MTMFLSRRLRVAYYSLTPRQRVGVTPQQLAAITPPVEDNL